MRYTRYTTPTELQWGIDYLIQANSLMAETTTELLLATEDGNETFQLDIDLRRKYEFDTILTKNDVNPSHPLYTMLGPISLKHITAQGFLAEYNDGTPFYLILYLSETGALRGYIPRHGNAVNPLTGGPYGDGGMPDDLMAQRFGYDNYADMDYKEPSVQNHFYDKTLLIHDITTQIQTQPY